MKALGDLIRFFSSCALLMYPEEGDSYTKVSSRSV